jgi:hypothetical protein
MPVSTTLDDVTKLVRDAFDQAQESLVRLEEAAQAEDRPALHRLSQAYARLLSPLRDFLAGVNMGRALPRQLAKRIAEPSDAIFELVEDVRSLGLLPDGDALTRLIETAETAT